MTLEDKELLLKDLCARLPYGVWVNRKFKSFKSYTKSVLNGYDIVAINQGEYDFCKPYLFPLSSMTEEQKEELKDLISQQTKILIEQLKNDDCGIDCGKYHFHSLLELDWCIKNNFDYRGLIPMGLANDATGLNIY